MSSDDLTRAQLDQLRDALYPGANYIVRLKDRMAKLGFPPDDPVYRLVTEIQRLNQQLGMELTYRSSRDKAGARQYDGACPPPVDFGRPES